MKRLQLHFLFAALSTTALSGLVACGGISDPNKTHPAENVATLTGKLTASSVPANAHVALVWRNNITKSYAVGADVPVINGAFSMSLSVPDADFFVNVDEQEESSFVGGNSGGLGGSATELPSVGTGPNTGSAGSSSGSSGTSTPVTSVDAGTPSGGSSGGSSGSSGSSGATPDFNQANANANIHPQTDVSGSTISNPLSAAVAGFVVYVDGNGNGKLDLSGAEASSVDQVVGGNKELLLTYLKDGGNLDYEKLRDSANILPAAGYNLAWANKNRWFPLNEVELKISSTAAKLPNAICEYESSTVDYGGTAPSIKSGGTNGSDPDAPSSGSGSSGSSSGSTSSPYQPYPSKGDPNLHCSADGYSWTYDGGWQNSCGSSSGGSTSGGTTPTPTPPPPTGLCTSDDILFDDAPNTTTPEPCGGITGESAPPGDKVPVDWPCDVAGTVEVDSGVPATDAGSPGVDGGI